MVEKITLEEAIKLICDHAYVCDETEVLAVEKAGGYLLAEDV